MWNRNKLKKSRLHCRNTMHGIDCVWIPDWLNRRVCVWVCVVVIDFLVCCACQFFESIIGWWRGWFTRANKSRSNVPGWPSWLVPDWLGHRKTGSRNHRPGQQMLEQPPRRYSSPERRQVLDRGQVKRLGELFEWRRHLQSLLSLYSCHFGQTLRLVGRHSLLWNDVAMASWQYWLALMVSWTGLSRCRAETFVLQQPWLLNKRVAEKKRIKKSLLFILAIQSIIEDIISIPWEQTSFRFKLFGWMESAIGESVRWSLIAGGIGVILALALTTSLYSVVFEMAVESSGFCSALSRSTILRLGFSSSFVIPPFFQNDTTTFKLDIVITNE